MPRIVALLIAASLALAAAAQEPYPALESRAAALQALEDPDPRFRLAGVVYFGRNGLATDGPLLVKRLSDENPVVREVAGQAVWLAWSRSGDAEVDRLLESGVAEMDAKRYPRAQCFVVEEGPGREAAARRALGRPWWRIGGAAPHFGPVPDGGVQMLWSNMALHLSADPQALIARWHRALDVDGFLMFSCLGPDTVRELRALYQALGWPPAAHEYTDMHDWGDMLVQAGFAEPVMDMERITLTYETPARLVQELREIGRNLHPARFGALRGRGGRSLHTAAGRGPAPCRSRR